jgi:hypothetical protein
MKDMINDRLLQLAAAQNSVIDLSICIDQWEQSQLMLEKSAFEAMNTADKILNLSKEGFSLVDQLQNHFLKGMEHIHSEQLEQVRTLFGNLHALYQQILENAHLANETAHDFEVEVATQREIGENMLKSVSCIGESVEAALACAEFIIADM